MNKVSLHHVINQTIDGTLNATRFTCICYVKYTIKDNMVRQRLRPKCKKRQLSPATIESQINYFDELTKCRQLSPKCKKRQLSPK